MFRKRSEIETKRRLISRSLIRWSLRLKKFEGCVWRNGHCVKCQEELLSFAVLSFLFMAFNFPPQIVLLYPFCVCRFYSSFTVDSYHFIALFLLRKENTAFWETRKFNFLSRLRYLKCFSKHVKYFSKYVCVKYIHVLHLQKLDLLLFTYCSILIIKLKFSKYKK